MFKKLMLGATTAALGLSALAAPTAASAQRYYGGDRYEQAYGDAYQDGYNRGPRYYEQRGYDARAYDERGYYDQRDRGGYAYRDRGYAPRRCNSGSTGTIVGAIAGGLLGNSIAGRGDRTLGAILGAGGGALAGRAIGRADNPGYCR